MAVFTPISLEEASRVTEAHGLGAASGLIPIAAGSVNTNYFVEGAAGRKFLRIYEEQGVDGVAYEWTLLAHLQRQGLPVPRRVEGPQAGDVTVAGKPVALFECVPGEPSCQKAVSPVRAEAVGGMLARAHHAVSGFGARPGRFDLASLRKRLEGIDPGASPELDEALRELRDALDDVESAWPAELPRGVIHGDLFRDNVHWEGDRVVALIDWESAEDGILVYDLMVTVLAWCFGEGFDWALARALVGRYSRLRRLSDEEWAALRTCAMGAAVRFATTRITDFTLRASVGDRVYKDYRRFLQRLRALQALSDEALVHLLAPKNRAG